MRLFIHGLEFDDYNFCNKKIDTLFGSGML